MCWKWFIRVHFQQKYSQMRISYKGWKLEPTSTVYYKPYEFISDGSFSVQRFFSSDFVFCFCLRNFGDEGENELLGTFILRRAKAPRLTVWLDGLCFGVANVPSIKYYSFCAISYFELSFSLRHFILNEVKQRNQRSAWLQVM